MWTLSRMRHFRILRCCRFRGQLSIAHANVSSRSITSFRGSERDVATIGGPSIKHHIQAQLDAVAGRPRARPAIRGPARPIVFSLIRLIEQESKSTAYWRVLRRSLLLFALGLVYGGVTESWPNSGVNESWPDIRLLGVLNRIALCSLFTSLLFLNPRLPGLIVSFVAISAGYWSRWTFVSVSGIGVGSYAKDANLANWIDAQYLPGRKWNGAWDPEGLLGTLPAIGTCLLGVFARLLLKEPSLQPHQKTLWLIGAGISMIALGVLWGLQFPIVKNIWTSSYVLVCGGLSAHLLGVFHQVIDAWERRNWATIFIWIGASAITLYFINGIVGF